ncbi:MAG: ATP-binding cassette domain-containing protein [Alphaproteobacteria bacterium]|nr:ATP-binding cassette domain-containing protein [Alphaproteobacteria bacterium]
MSLLSIDNGFFSFGDKVILGGVSFNINQSDKIGLVGDNGAGKSTLLKILMGQLELARGAVMRGRDLRKIGYIEQDISKDLEDKTLREVLLDAIPATAWDYNAWKADVALENIGAPADHWDKKISELSGGWRRLALIARTNLGNPDLIIFDEPTNYLDLEKILHLENWFRTSLDCPYLMVSHDRQFLDNVTNRTLTLRAGDVIDHKLPYSKSRDVILKQDILDAKKRQEQADEVKRLERAARQLVVWDQFTSKHQAILTRAARIKDNLTDAYKEKKRDINLRQEQIRPNVVLRIKDCDIKTPDGKKLFRINDLYVSRGDKIVLLGVNGSGKTQCLKALAAAYAAEGGAAVKFNPQVNMGYFDQNMDSLPADATIADHLQAATGLSNQGVSTSLIKAGFPYKELGKKIGALSFGERARYFFLLLHHLHKNFFILDEPTNHLDIDGQEKLEDELLNNDNTCIFVSHDRRFVQSVATRLMMIDHGKLVEIDSPEVFYSKLKYYNNL